MVRRLSPRAALQPITIAPLDISGNLPFRVQPKGDFIRSPRGREQPRRLPPRIRNAIPKREDRSTNPKRLVDLHPTGPSGIWWLWMAYRGCALARHLITSFVVGREFRIPNSEFRISLVN